MRHTCRFILTLAVAGLACLLSGCLESTMLLKVNTDGSGSFRVRYLRIGGEGSGYNQDALVAMASRLGEGVTLDRSKEIANETRKGFLAEYSFTDVSKLRPEAIEGVLGFQGQPRVKPKYRFAFTAGQPATLTIRPAWESTGAEGVAGLAPVDTEGGLMSPEQQERLTSVQEQLGNLLLAFYVQVNGEIVETNATQRMQNTPSTITLHYINMAKRPTVLDMARIVQAANATDVSNLAKASIPGIRLEDPANPVTIKFQ